MYFVPTLFKPGFEALHFKNGQASKKLALPSCQPGAQPCSSPLSASTCAKCLEDASGGCRTVLVRTAGVRSGRDCIVMQMDSAPDTAAFQN